MAEETLDRKILIEIRERLKEARAAVEEYHRLEAALQALEPPASESTSGASRDGATANRNRTRAPRGANRDKALRTINDRPGITVAELSSATGIRKNVLYSLTRTLTEQGLIERVALPGDTFGFRRARGDGSSTT